MLGQFTELRGGYPKKRGCFWGGWYPNVHYEHSYINFSVSSPWNSPKNKYIRNVSLIIDNFIARYFIQAENKWPENGVYLKLRSRAKTNLPAFSLKPWKARLPNDHNTRKMFLLGSVPPVMFVEIIHHCLELTLFVREKHMGSRGEAYISVAE